MVGDRTLCTRSTLGGQAGILTFRVDTSLTLATLTVGCTASSTESLLTDVSSATVFIAVTQRSTRALDTDLIEEAVFIV